MKLLSLGDNVFDAYLFRKELYPGGNAANVSVLARRAGAEETTLYADLDLDRLAAVRTQLPILSGRRTDLYEIGER